MILKSLVYFMTPIVLYTWHTMFGFMYFLQAYSVLLPTTDEYSSTLWQYSLIRCEYQYSLSGIRIPSDPLGSSYSLFTIKHIDFVMFALLPTMIVKIVTIFENALNIYRIFIKLKFFYFFITTLKHIYFIFFLKFYCQLP